MQTIIHSFVLEAFFLLTFFSPYPILVFAILGLLKASKVDL